MRKPIQQHVFFLTALALGLLWFPFVSTPEAHETFRIISARYGIPGNYVDVTQAVKGLVSGHSISMEVSNINLKTDPVPGKAKEMVVFFEIQGVKKELRIKEGDWFVFPGPDCGYRPRHHGAGDLEIIRALYGADGKYRIVTGDVQNHVVQNNINMLVSNKNLGGDPAPNHKKEFLIIYRKEGREYGAHLEEGSWFIITD